MNRSLMTFSLDNSSRGLYTAQKSRCEYLVVPNGANPKLIRVESVASLLYSLIHPHAERKIHPKSILNLDWRHIESGDQEFG